MGKISAPEAKKCLALLDSLDMHVLEHCNVMKRGSVVYSDDVNKLRLKFRNHWQSNPTIIDDFIAAQKKFPPADADVVKKWKGIKRQNYVIVRHYQNYSVFASTTNPHNRLYGVLALTDDFQEMLPSKDQLIVETSLLPYKGQIIWDGLVCIYSIYFGSNLGRLLTEDCISARKDKEIIMSLE